MKILAWFETKSKTMIILMGLYLIAGIGLLDYLTGIDISFSLFYLLPISLVTWYTNKRFGLIVSVISAFVWLIAEVSSKNPLTNTAIFFWNTAIRFGFFYTVTLLLAALRNALDHEQNLSRIDQMTGATSSNFFYDLLQLEMDRFLRYKHPFTVAYIDLDNFKSVNDQFGHHTGDQVLRTVVSHARKELRKTDIVARMGGDEFVVLFPEATSITAQVVVSRIQQGLLREMKNGTWPVTFSIGVITFFAIPKTTNDLIKMVDTLMYEVKNNGKNAISYSVFNG